LATRTVPAKDRPTVLLVEDDEALRSALRFALEVDGFVVWTFATGEAVLDLKRLPDSALLVLDEKLPGISGLDLLESLRARALDIPVVLITTSTSPVRERAANLGAPIIEKPLLGDDFLHQVHAMAAVVRSGAGSHEPN
jgi:FixJ family two-component response regulator